MQYLRSEDSRVQHLRLDVAKLLKRLHFVERSLIKAQAGWIPSVAHFETKLALAHILWQDAMTAHECRERVFELRYPSRLMEIGEDALLVELSDAVTDSPNSLAFVRSLAEVFKPALKGTYQQYLDVADDLADGPSVRFLQAAVRDKAEQIERLGELAREIRSMTDEAGVAAADDWVAALHANLKAIGGIGFEPHGSDARLQELPHRIPFQIAREPARDPRFPYARFYWPDTIDKSFPYGEGIMLQLRSAVSHLNEVWAVESGGVILYAFAEELGWDYIYNVSRWTYDEARHTRMGYERLRGWGFDRSEMPVGSYIYDSAAGQDPIVRLSMLHYFETKNIGKKTERAEAFHSYDDTVSQRDMEFDWADETLHAHYGRRWLKVLQDKDPERYPAHDVLGERCEELVAATIAAATDTERQRSRELATDMIEKAKVLAAKASHD